MVARLYCETVRTSKVVFALMGLIGAISHSTSYSTAWGQSSPSDVVVPSATAPSAAVPAGRILAPDAFFVINPGAEEGDTFEGPIDLPLTTPESELVWGPPSHPNNAPFYGPASETLLAMTRGVIFRRNVWALEFGFKPVRMIAVDLPGPDGQMESKVVWYLLYSVRYKGGDLQPLPIEQLDGVANPGAPTQTSGTLYQRFLPGFVINCHDVGTRYQSRYIPEAIPLISEKERVGKPIYDNFAISRVRLNQGEQVWGVATWVDVDPRTDFFSIEVRGLTNAQKSKVEDNQLISQQKTLVLNFSRPGDAVNIMADRIRYGIPRSSDPVEQRQNFAKYGLSPDMNRLDHYWIYR